MTCPIRHEPRTTCCECDNEELKTQLKLQKPVIEAAINFADGYAGPLSHLTDIRVLRRTVEAYKEKVSVRRHITATGEVEVSRT